MATGSRRPLTSRALPLQIPTVISPLKPVARNVNPSKRARSPEPAADANTSAKRVRAVPLLSPATTATREEERERKRLERDAQKEEFRVKYMRAFPKWTFHFDLDVLDPESSSVREHLSSRVLSLNGRVEDFFSKQITHLITNQPLPSEDDSTNKENLRRTRGAASAAVSLLRSPIKLRGRNRAVEESALTASAYDLVRKALGFGMKVWTTAKLESVLDRCLGPCTPSRAISMQETSSNAIFRQRSLTRLLESERLQGTTTERDPTQKRHDFHYFSRSSYFVLVEDLRQELATIAAVEYPIVKARDGAERGDWPVLHCHPKARGPFIEFNEKERKIWQRAQKAHNKEEKEQRRASLRQQDIKQKAQLKLQATKAGDLRRSVSMNNLHRKVSLPDPGLDMVDLDADGCDNVDSANASGYLASTGTGGGYIAASGNSVGITSTTGTTSAVGNALRNLQLPAALRGRMQQEVVTSRKFPTADKDSGKKNVEMGPPTGLPDRPFLRKSRSTNTMRLPKRDEGNKPGYCESCRQKFEDFKSHIQGRRHRKFATDDAHYLQLDFVLSRVQRRTTQQAEAERHSWESGDHEEDRFTFGAESSDLPQYDSTADHADVDVDESMQLILSETGDRVQLSI